MSSDWGGQSNLEDTSSNCILHGHVNRPSEFQHVWRASWATLPKQHYQFLSLEKKEKYVWLSGLPPIEFLTR